MSVNTILTIYLLRKHIKLSTFRSQSAKKACARNEIFVNPRKYHVRENILSYSMQYELLRNIRLRVFIDTNLSTLSQETASVARGNQ